MRSSGNQPQPAGTFGPPRAPEDPAADEALLDRYFDDATSALQDGHEISVDGQLFGRDDLATQFERLTDLARFVAPGPAEQAPPVDGYTILSELGRGGMAAVYLARQEKLGGRVVALKVLPRHVALSRRARERFRAETLAIARQKHPGIVPVYDVIDDGTTLAFAMEWVDGRTLEDVITRVRQELGGAIAGGREDRRAITIVRAFTEGPVNAFPEPSYSRLIARVGLTAARALHAVHQTGLLHRDLKPSNLLLRRDGAALLSDFGLARDLDAPTATVGESFLGTAPYSAPEQLRGRRDLLDPRSDVYSLGATLYHALALRPPFASRSPVEVLACMESRGPEPLSLACPGAPEDLCTIIAKAMDPEPARRYPTSAAMGEDLQRFLEDRPILARPASVASRLRKFVRRNRVMLATGIAVGAVVAGAATGLVTREFYYPRWAQASLDQARTQVLTREHGFQMYNHAFFGTKTPSIWPSSVDSLRRAAQSYERALSFDSDLAPARVERDVLLAIVRYSPPRAPADDPAFRTEYPLTAAYLLAAAAQANSEPARKLDEHETVLPDVERASSGDLRALGLAALMLMDPSTAVEAWRELERRVDDDPIVAAALGMLYVCEERYPMAYPRLRDAVRAYPGSGMFRQFAAEAAWGCGDTIKARQYLDAAATLPEHDDMAEYRLRTLLRIGEGDLDGALDQYRRDMAGPVRLVADNGILQYQLGRELERRGDLESAVYFFAFGTGGDNWLARRSSRVFLPAVRRWWAGLDDRSRRAKLAAIFDGGGWWDRSAAARPFVAYPDSSAWWPMPTAPEHAAAAGQLEEVCRRVLKDCATEPHDLPVGRDQAERDEIVEWWMTGKQRSAGPALPLTDPAPRPDPRPERP